MGTPLVEGQRIEPQRVTLRLSNGVNLLNRSLGEYSGEVFPPDQDLRVVRLQRGIYNGGEHKVFRARLNNGDHVFVATEARADGSIIKDTLTKVAIFYSTGAVRIYDPEVGESKTYPHLVGAPELQEPWEEIKRDLNFGSPDFIQQFKP